METIKRDENNARHRKVLPYNEVFGSRTRFIIMLLLLICLAAVWCNVLTFNIAIICMHPHRNRNGSLTSLELRLAQESKTEHDPDDPHVIGFFGKQIIWYTPGDKSLLISAVAVGALAANVPVVWLTNHYGIRMTFGLLGILSSLATTAIPIAARLGLHYFLAIRTIQGIAFAANFSVIGSFSSRWTYFKQNGMMVSALVAHFQLAPAITMPIGGFLCTNFGWPSVYYWHGIASFVLFAFFILAYRNSPSKHPFVSDIELNKIALGKDVVTKSEQRQVPYAKILKTYAVWAVWIAAVGNFTCVNLMFLYSPTFLHAVLGFHVHHTGITAAFPPLLQFAIKIACGVASDKIRNVNESTKLKVFNSLAFFGSAACLMALALTDPQYRLLSFGFLAVSIGFLGLTTGGFFKSGPLIARHYASFVTGNVSLGMTLTMILVPFGVSILAPDNSAEQWKRVFFVTAVILVTTNVFFVVFGSATICSWAISQSAVQSQTNSTRFSINTKVLPVENRNSNTERPAAN
uniref:MFS domain-containing protein n=1 Tax=Ascaris lumbricoides TaxID=6252 RepID=A0A0M3I2T3_ASCLU